MHLAAVMSRIQPLLSDDIPLTCFEAYCVFCAYVYVSGIAVNIGVASTDAKRFIQDHSWLLCKTVT